MRINQEGDADFFSIPLANLPDLLFIIGLFFLLPFLKFFSYVLISEEFSYFGEQPPCQDFDLFFRNLDALRSLSHATVLSSLRFRRIYKGLPCQCRQHKPFSLSYIILPPLDYKYRLAHIREKVKQNAERIFDKCLYDKNLIVKRKSYIRNSVPLWFCQPSV